jgi:ubiquitin-protein ligase
MDIEEVFNLIKSKTMAKRLKRELDTLIDLYVIIQVDFTNKGELKLFLQKKEDYNFNIFCFTFSNDYPFRPPTITINNKGYFDSLRLNSPRFNTVLTYLNGLNCLCCSSFLCRDHWSPAFTVKKILEEIDNYKLIKRNIIRKLLLDKIKDQYLISDIDLDSWLFNVMSPSRILQFPKLVN